MIEGLSVLSIIGARGNSKGLPGKNVMPLGGRPLLDWSIGAAEKSACVDRICVSSDDDKILDIASAHQGVVTIKRPEALATDTARVEDAIMHALDTLDEEFDIVVLLQPTSPLRTAEDIDSTIQACISGSSPAAVSVTTPGKSPYWMCTMNTDGTLETLIETDTSVHRRQDLPVAYAYNGAVYVARRDYFVANQTFFGPETVGYVMPPERSVDIDTELDLLIAETIVAAGIETPAKTGNEIR